MNMDELMINLNKSQYFLDDVESHQIVNYKRFAQNLYLNQDQYFSTASIARRHGDEYIEAIVQYPDYIGFKETQSQGYQDKIKMKISEYIDYQKNYQNKHYLQTFKYKNYINKGQIIYAVNIDISKWTEEMNFLEETLPEQLNSRSKYDALSYCRELMPGITSPQAYLKVKGCWTGGHQENLSVRSININLGPGSSEWFAIDANQVKQMREYYNKFHQNDLLKNEGLWFLTIDKLQESGVAVKRTIQEPGDMILLGPGCLHWVKSLGVSTHISWNIMHRKFIDEMYKRFQINKKINFVSLIPYQLLIVDLLNHEANTLDLNLVKELQKNLNYFYQDEKKQLQEFKKNFYDKQKDNEIESGDDFFNSKAGISYQKNNKMSIKMIIREVSQEQNSIVHCSLCSKPLFNIFCQCQYCFNYPISFCLNCYQKHSQDCKIPAYIIFFIRFKEYQLKQLNYLIDQVILNREDSNSSNSSVNNNVEINSICAKHQYIGSVNCSKTSESDSNYLDNIILEQFIESLQEKIQQINNISEEPFSTIYQSTTSYQNDAQFKQFKDSSLIQKSNNNHKLQTGYNFSYNNNNIIDSNEQSQEKSQKIETKKKGGRNPNAGQKKQKNTKKSKQVQQQQKVKIEQSTQEYDSFDEEQKIKPEINKTEDDNKIIDAKLDLEQNSLRIIQQNDELSSNQDSKNISQNQILLDIQQTIDIQHKNEQEHLQSQNSQDDIFISALQQQEKIDKINKNEDQKEITKENKIEIEPTCFQQQNQITQELPKENDQQQNPAEQTEPSQIPEVQTIQEKIINEEQKEECIPNQVEDQKSQKNENEEEINKKRKSNSKSCSQNKSEPSLAKKRVTFQENVEQTNKQVDEEENEEEEYIEAQEKKKKKTARKSKKKRNTNKKQRKQQTKNKQQNEEVQQSNSSKKKKKKRRR